MLYNVKVKELDKRSVAKLGMQTGCTISVPAQELLLLMLSRSADARPSALECLMDSKIARITVYAPRSSSACPRWLVTPVDAGHAASHGFLQS